MPPDVSLKRDQQNFGYIIRSGLAGGFAGCIAKTVVAPLDRVKILFQTSNPDFQKYAGSWRGAYRAGVEIYRQDGARGLLQGHSATLLRIFPYAAIKFMSYDQVHHVLMPTRESETNLRRFAAGSISGTISVCITYPLELVRVRLAFITRSVDNLSGAVPARPALRKAISDIYNESASFKSPASVSTTPTNALRAQLFAHFPILSFYRGFTVTLLGMVPYAGTSFLLWGYLRAIVLPPPSAAAPNRKQKPTPLADLAIGAVSGAVAQTVSYPFEVVRRRMQVGGLVARANPDPRVWPTFVGTIRSIWRASGWRGFFIGLGIGYLKIVPMTATSFAVWQWGKRVLDV